MKCGTDFKVGYSPERVNPGDKAHSLDKITKIVSGMDEESTRLLDKLHGLITHGYVARDINIALMNELSLIFHKTGLNTQDVLEAAGMRWN